MTVTYRASEIHGLSSDTKPSNVAEGRIFLETDTAKRYIYTSGSWVELSAGGSEGYPYFEYNETIGDYSFADGSITASSGTTRISTTSTKYGTWATDPVPAYQDDQDDATNTNYARWHSSYGASAVVADTGSTQSIGVVQIRWAGYHASGNYARTEIGYSSSATAWGSTSGYTSYYDTTATNTIHEDFIPINQTTRYIQWRLLTAYDGAYPMFRVHQLNVFAETTPAFFLNESSSNYAATTNETHPYFVIDYGSDKLVSGIAIKLHSNNTVDEFKIQWSSDNSTWSDLRTINATTLTADSNEFIRFNPEQCRYLRIYGNDSTAKTLAITQLKSQFFNSFGKIYGHGTISTSDTSLPNSGVS